MPLCLSDPQRSRAVLIGVNAFEHLHDIPAVRNNLIGMRDALADPRTWGLPQEHITTVAQPMEARTVLDAVEDAYARAEDTLLLYYAGHGLTDGEFSDELLLALPHTRERRPDSALRYEDIRRALKRDRTAKETKRLVVVLDCCYAGRALRGAMSVGQDLADLADTVLDEHSANGQGRCVLAAAARTALAPVDATFTLFTGELLEVLTRGIPHAPALMDMARIYRELRRRLTARSGPLPELGSRGDPASICIARNRSADKILAKPVIQAEASAPSPQPRPSPETSGTHGVPASIAALVRAYLYEQPKEGGLYVAREGHFENRPVQQARKLFRFAPFETLLAVWQYATVIPVLTRSPKALAITSHGIRMPWHDGEQFFVPYAEFKHCTFSSSSYEAWVEADGAHRRETFHWLQVETPRRRWSSPELPSSSPKAMAARLNHIKRLATS
ncbi:caspase family protein [Streptomyces sp. NPDC002039]|uniref:caspase, EACC1-associated type n=1 Tax=Streptomyces sp. NPDC002039 TaxID=3154660 RepID=UPI003331E488